MKCILTSIACLVSIGFQIITLSAVSANDELWDALGSGNHLVLIRHALAPGFSDPDGFNIKECSTQRNLNKKGREQARAIGERFRIKGIYAAMVYSSQWCRCLETARLLELGQVNHLEMLNSFFENFNRKQKRTIATQRWIAKAPLTSPTVLVTHQVNITALTGISPSSGEVVFVKRGAKGQFSVIGTIKTLR